MPRGFAQRIQDRIHVLVKEGRWQEIVAEKRAALQQIKHTLDTYHRLLTQAPVPADGVLKLLQSIVRCVHSRVGLGRRSLSACQLSS